LSEKVLVMGCVGGLMAGGVLRSVCRGKAFAAWVA
jgi:hypothetical protein